jgi:hypothetical protein
MQIDFILRKSDFLDLQERVPSGTYNTGESPTPQFCTLEVIRVYLPYRLLWNRRTDVRSYGILFTAIPPSSPTRQHMSGCRRKNCDVAHTGLKTQCEPARHSK